MPLPSPSKQVTPDPIHLFQKDIKGFVFGEMELPREKTPNTDIWDGPFSEKARSPTSDAGISPRNPYTCSGQTCPSALHLTCIHKQIARAHQIFQRNYQLGQDKYTTRGLRNTFLKSYNKSPQKGYLFLQTEQDN